MNWGDLLHTFELHNNQIVYQEIDTIPQIDANALIYHGQLDLDFAVETLLPEFIRQTYRVSFLKKSGAKGGMFFDGCANDGMRALFYPGYLWGTLCPLG